MIKNLVIVESPAKAKTISKFLGKEYKVLASMGHIRDLPKTTLGFDEKTFEPRYQISKDKTKVIKEIKKYINKDTNIFLATDEDREGEAIAWHLIPALKIEKNPIFRIVFHEVTKQAILNAISTPRDIDQNLVNAQQARRLLDRAVGYKLSPLLWKKIKAGLSAGRVQSVAVRIIVEREREIENFTPQEFWKIKANFSNPSFSAELEKYNNKKITVKNEQEAKEIEKVLKSGKFRLIDIIQKESIKNPAPPFTTSTLQQEASRKLGFSVKQTMTIAQQLYEGNFELPNHTGGLITYMRTDSLNLSEVALKQAKKVIQKEYGEEFALNKPRVYKTKSKNAQEAHEAIRPVNLEIKPKDIKTYLNLAQYRLYKLIYERTIATQMKSAKILNTTYIIKNSNYQFSAKGNQIKFPGFMLAYVEENDDGKAIELKDKLLPEIKKDSILNMKKLDLTQNFTKPPARYTEASLVKKLESEGIGRPSTYAPTIATIQAREYIILNEEKRLVPTQIGKVVNDFLVENFAEIVDLGFTAKIEDELDEIATGKIEWKKPLREFYEKFVNEIEQIAKNVPRVQFGRTKELGVEKESFKKVYAKVGRYGPYLQIGENEDSDKRIFTLPKKIDIQNLTLQEALNYAKLPRVLGKDEEGNEIKVNIGKYGPYVQIGSKFISIKGKDVYTITFDEVIKIIKQSPKTQNNIIKEFSKEKIQVLNGRYGPYIKKGKKNYKIPKEMLNDLQNITLEKVNKIIKKSEST